ncbi:MAG: hypothetical protein DRP92_06300 [Candidatus Neomarinimicrobiota bacterium]|nr:MAG: hypothetical protein DRP92_06300 [Candidatus Neomarinimicrobiota bacterium]
MILPSPVRCFWPINSSKLEGLILSASGGKIFSSFVSNSSIDLASEFRGSITENQVLGVSEIISCFHPDFETVHRREILAPTNLLKCLWWAGKGGVEIVLIKKGEEIMKRIVFCFAVLQSQLQNGYGSF